MIENSSENELFTVINNMPGGLCVFNFIDQYPYIEVTVWNKYMEKITGFSREEINRTGIFHVCSIKQEQDCINKAFTEMNKKETLIQIKDIADMNRLLKLKISSINTDKIKESYIVLASEIPENTDYGNEVLRIKESETILREVVDNTADLLAIFTPDFRIKYISPSHADVLGYPLEKLKSMRMGDLTYLGEENIIAKFGNDLIKSKETVKCQFKILCADHSFKYLETIGKPLYNNGLLEGYILSSRDVTARVKTEEDLVKSKKRFRTLFNNVNDAIYMYKLDEEGSPSKFVEVNDRACNRLEYTREEMMSMTISDVIPDLKDIISYIIETVESKGNSLYEACAKTKSGRIIPVEINSISLDLNNEKFILSISRDITERKEKERADEFERLRAEFFANISHELRTPVNVIFSALQLINSRINDTSLNAVLYKKYMPVMKQNCYRLVRLINNLIDVTKIDAGFMKLNLSNVDIVDLFESITLSVTQYIEYQGMSLLFDTNVEEKIITCDADKLERIVLNLISNAVKFSKSGDSIFVNLMDTEEKVIISVKDTGIGIAEENQSLIFDRFAQVDKSFARNREGSGIGLSLVKSMVEMHNGTIEVKSQLNKGSEFIITLPVNLVEEKSEIKDTRNYLISDNVEKIKIEFSDIYSSQG